MAKFTNGESMCVDIAKLYETLTLNAIAIFMFI
jgi:hypothetical protein